MEVMCHAEFVTDPLPYEVSPDATAAQILRDVCALFGREEEDTALEVDGVVVWTTADDAGVKAGSLGLHAGSSVVVKRDREKILEMVAEVLPWEKPRYRDDWGMPEWVWDDLIVMTALVRMCGGYLEFASDELKNTESVVLEAVTEFGLSLQYASDEMKNTQSVVLAAVKEFGFSLEFASDAMQNTQAVVLAAVKRTGCALGYASDAMKNTLPVVYEAVNENHEALGFASAEMQKEPSVVLAARRPDGVCFSSKFR